MVGQRRCRFHGGASPQALRAATHRIERARVIVAMGRLGVPVEGGADPLEVLAHALSVADCNLRAMQAMVANVEPTSANDPTVRLYAEVLDRAGRLAKVAGRYELGGAAGGYERGQRAHRRGGGTPCGGLRADGPHTPAGRGERSGPRTPERGECLTSTGSPPCSPDRVTASCEVIGRGKR